MRQPVDFLSIEGGQSACDALPPQIVLFGMVAHVSRHRLVPPFNAEFFAASLLNQFTRIPETNSEKLHETDRIGLLPGIIPFLRSPLNKAGPAGQRGQLQRQIVLPQLCRNPERVQTFQQGIFGMFWQPRDFLAAVYNSTGRPLMYGESFPCTVQPLLSSWHGPGRMAFVEVRLAPFDQLIVDLLDDLRAERVVAPVRECEPATQRRLITLRDCEDALAQIRK